MHSAERPDTASVNPAEKGEPRCSLARPGSSSQPFRVTVKALHRFCIRRKRAAVWPPRGPRRPWGWRSRRGVALTSRGGRGASGSNIPGGPVAADSHKWHLDGGGRNKRSLALPPGNAPRSSPQLPPFITQPPPDVATEGSHGTPPKPGAPRALLPARHSWELSPQETKMGWEG